MAQRFLPDAKFSQNMVRRAFLHRTDDLYHTLKFCIASSLFPACLFARVQQIVRCGRVGCFFSFFSYADNCCFIGALGACRHDGWRLDATPSTFHVITVRCGVNYIAEKYFSLTIIS